MFVECGSPSALIKMNRSKSDIRLYAIHPGGGFALPYVMLAKCLENQVSFIGVQAPDLFFNIDHTDLRSLILDHVKAIKQHNKTDIYFLLGWSYGGALAYEIACELHRQGNKIEYLCVMDIPPIMDIGQCAENKTWCDIAEDIYGSEVSIDWSCVKSIPEDEGILTIARAMEKNKNTHLDINSSKFRFIRYRIKEACWFHSYKASKSSLEFDLVVANKTQEEELIKYDYGIRPEPYWEQWRWFTSGEVRLIETNGNHHEMLKQPYIESVTDKIKVNIPKAFEI